MSDSVADLLAIKRVWTRASDCSKLNYIENEISGSEPSSLRRPIDTSQSSEVEMLTLIVTCLFRNFLEFHQNPNKSVIMFTAKYLQNLH